MKSILLCICLVFLCSCQQKKQVKNYEVKDDAAANLSLTYYPLYPHEILNISINGESIYETIGDTIKTHLPIRKYFNIPASIKSMMVSSKYNGRQILNKTFINDLQVPKLSLFISMPYPIREKISQDPAWKPTWGKIPIDSSERIVKLEPDSLPYWKF